MAIAELVLKYLGVVIWPAVVLVAIIVFRHPLAQLVGRVTEASALGATIKFAQAAKEAATLSEAIPDPPEPTPNPSEPLPDQRPYQSVIGQMFTEWVFVEISANRAIGRVSQGSFHTQEAIFNELLRGAFISQETWDVARRLRKLRNEIAHGKVGFVTADAADDFIQASRKLVKVLDGIGRPALPGEGKLGR